MPFDPSKTLKENMAVLHRECAEWQTYLQEAAADHEKIEVPTTSQKLTRARMRFMAANVSVTKASAKEQIDQKDMP
jgi:hypothetical protein